MGQSSQIPRILAFFTSKKTSMQRKDEILGIQGSANAAVIKPRPSSQYFFFLTPFRHEFKRRFSLESGR